MKDLNNYEFDERFMQLEDVLLAYSHGDFSKKLPISDKLDPIDTVMSGINMLGEELEETTIKRDFFNSAFHSITDSLVVINNSGIIIDLNESFICLLELQKEDIIGKNLTTFLKFKSFEKTIQSLYKNQKTIDFESEIQTSLDKKIMVECHVSVIDNNKCHSLVKIHDLTYKIQQEASRIATIIKTQEEERNRVASDLHDSIGQQISALKFYFDSIQKQKDDKLRTVLLKKTESLIDNVADEIRNICFQLMPRSVEKFGLSDSIKQLADIIQFSTGIHFDLKLVESKIKIDSNISMSVYRIIQEFVNNSIKHAKCKNIKINFEVKPKILTLTMIDDGVGFGESSSKRKGNGLDNINLRVKYLNGEVEFISEKDKGVILNISIPLNS
ncbi:MAG: PAS domain-containing protein [bacterium]|nr:PAS domain-containing protein [bacterium]